MKNTMKLAVAGLVLSGAIGQGLAQGTVDVQFNAQTLSIALTGYAQGNDNAGNSTATKVRITTKDVITALGGTAKTRLLILNPVDPSTANTELVLRDVANKQNVDTDVTQWFSADTVMVVENSRTKNNKTTGTQYSIERYMFGGSGEGSPNSSFDVQGFTTSNLANGSFSSNVNGTGNINGGDAVVTGKIAGSPVKLETRTITIGG